MPWKTFGAKIFVGKKIAVDIWNIKFQELVDFKEKHGHSRLPQSYPELGKWVSEQRDIFYQGRLCDERFERLKELGFTWDASKESSAAANLKTEEQEEGAISSAPMRRSHTTARKKRSSSALRRDKDRTSDSSSSSEEAPIQEGKSSGVPEKMQECDDDEEDRDFCQERVIEDAVNAVLEEKETEDEEGEGRGVDTAMSGKNGNANQGNDMSDSDEELSNDETTKPPPSKKLKHAGTGLQRLELLSRNGATVTRQSNEMTLNDLRKQVSDLQDIVQQQRRTLKLKHKVVLAQNGVYKDQEDTIERLRDTVKEQYDDINAKDKELKSLKMKLQEKREQDDATSSNTGTQDTNNDRIHNVPSRGRMLRNIQDQRIELLEAEKELLQYDANNMQNKNTHGDVPSREQLLRKIQDQRIGLLEEENKLLRFDANMQNTHTDQLSGWAEDDANEICALQRQNEALQRRIEALERRE
ncbi:helicase [Seminavis robusta]|uniref:Helicase n=1 Tax=Seminavis robusta TaxID=568900 RepID=A0A9N8DTR9_9STRA|nr:helicase [Seminavis robusta]|eukprot:Sro336_g120460.1 helicase (470) ;mRNA; r:72010-73419